MDTNLPFPIPVPGPGRGETNVRCADGTTHRVDGYLSISQIIALCGGFRPSTPAEPSPPSDPPQFEPPAAPIPDPAPLPPPPPTPTAPTQPIAPEYSYGGFSLQDSFVRALLRNRPTKESKATARRFDEAYGTFPLNIGRARRMARDVSTMQAQTDADVRAAARKRAEEARQRARDERLMRGERATRRRATAARGGRGIVGAVLGGAFGATDLGDGELTPAQRAEIDEIVLQRQEAYEKELDSWEIKPSTNRAGYPVGKLPGGNVDVRRRAESANTRGIILQAPSPAKMPPPAAPPVQQTSRTRRALGRILAMTRNPYGQLGVFGLSLLGGRRRSSSNAMPAEVLSSPLPPTVAEPFVPQSPPSPAPLTPFNPGALQFAPYGGFGGGVPTSVDNCNCKPKRRGPKRRCLERAQVAWRSGRYKGKPAGTRCVRWE